MKYPDVIGRWYLNKWKLSWSYSYKMFISLCSLTDKRVCMMCVGYVWPVIFNIIICNIRFVKYTILLVRNKPFRHAYFGWLWMHFLKSLFFLQRAVKDDVIIQPVVRYCSSSNQTYFLAAIGTVQGVCLLLGAFLAWETRKVIFFFFFLNQ